MAVAETEDPDSSLDNLYLALIQCFVVIFCGYLAGRSHMITQRDTSGLNTFVGKFSLPSLIFISLCQIDLSSVNWIFILAIFISKAIVFFLVLVVILVVSRANNCARAGLLAIFCTQTNDFAIGVPIVTALYGNSHPEFESYLYLLAPISLTILNPIGFVLMELGKQQTSITDGNREVMDSGRWQIIRNIIRNIITNPVVFMTGLGIIGNLIFDHQPPLVLEQILKVFGSAFTGTALMLLGLRMVGRVRYLKGGTLLITSLLIIAKLLLTPLVMREVVALLLKHRVEKDELLDFTTFSFLYGTLPSAPGVFVYAVSYGMDIDLVASSMVACTFLSGPLMFISAKMIMASTMDSDHIKKLFAAYEFDISVLSIVGGVIVFIVFVINRKFRFPHRQTAFLLISQMIGCMCSILTFYGISDIPKLVSIASDMCSALGTSSLAMIILFIHAGVDETLNSVQSALLILPWGIPMCLTSILLSLYDSSFPRQPFHMVAVGLTISVLLFSFIFTSICLIFAERNRRQNARYMSISEDDMPSNISGAVTSNGKKFDSVYDSGFVPWRMDVGASSPDTQESGTYFRRSVSMSSCCEEDMQLLRHFVLLVILLCSFTVSLAMLLWDMINESETGVYVEMGFIEVTLRRGQLFVAFCIFGLDYKNVLKPSVRWLVRMWYGGEPITLPKWDTLPFETRLLCDQFVSEHLQKSRVDIEKTKWSSLLYGKCFSGCALVDWLVRNKVCKDNEEAATYASKLLSGRVIRHIYNTEYFYSSPSMLYTFMVGST